LSGHSTCLPQSHLYLHGPEDTSRLSRYEIRCSSLSQTSRKHSDRDDEAVASCSGSETTRKKTARWGRDPHKVQPERFAVMLGSPGVGRSRSVSRMSYSRLPVQLTDTAWNLRSDFQLESPKRQASIVVRFYTIAVRKHVAVVPAETPIADRKRKKRGTMPGC
jgi:hypothetical protein